MAVPSGEQGVLDDKFEVWPCHEIVIWSKSRFGTSNTGVGLPPLKWGLRAWKLDACKPRPWSSAEGAIMASIEELAGTLQGLAGPGIKRKELVAAVR